MTVAQAVQQAFEDSEQQAAFFAWVRDGFGSCILEAVAGAGKTSTLLKALAMMVGTIFFGAYNKGIAVEIKAKAASIMRPGLFISTMHAAGLKGCRSKWNKTEVDNSKCTKIFRRIPEGDPRRQFEGQVLSLVSYAKQAAFGVTGQPAIENTSAWVRLAEHFDVECGESNEHLDTIIKLAQRLLVASNAACAESLDYDDMVYAPLVHRVKMWKHDWVLIDEAQDTNAARRLLALAMLKPNGRLVAVGDRHQAIYGFTGADHDALDLIGAAVNAQRMPLTVTFRCPQEVVKVAQRYVSHIQAAPTAPMGVVRELKTDLITEAKPGDVVLCRFNKPLIENVYAFIAAGVPAKVEGREIGNGLKQLAGRWKVKSYDALLSRLDAFVERETKKLTERDQLTKLEGVLDRVECLKVIIGRAMAKKPSTSTPVEDVNAEIDAIFADNVHGGKVVTFSTIHKAKGREWNKVCWLQMPPSPFAKQDWEMQQETNLMYVAATRAKKELVLC